MKAFAAWAVQHRWQIAMGAALVALFHRFLLGEVIFWGTPALQFFPWRDAAFDMLRQGVLPTWNPWVGSGAPLLANYQTAIFYPPNWLYLVIPTEYAMGWVALLHIPWAAVGMSLYLKRLGVDPLGQGVGALVFALSGYVIARFSFLSITSTVAWMPWLMWAVDGLFGVEHPRYLKPAAVLGGITAALLLAGHAQTAFYSLLLAGCYALWLSLKAQHSLIRLAWALGAVLLSAGIAAVQLVPTLELMRLSSRVDGVDNIEEVLTYSFWPWRLLTLLTPNLFGTPARNNYWGYANYWEDAVYIGLLPLVMACLAVLAWWRARSAGDAGQERLAHIPFFAAVVPLTLLLAMGRFTPVFPWLYANVPTFDLFRGPTRWSLLAVFALSVLAGVGASGWGSSTYRVKKAWLRRAAVLSAAVMLAVGLASMLLGEALRPTLALGFARLGLIGLCSAGLLLWRQRAATDAITRPRWEAALLALIALDLTAAHWGLNPTISPAFYRQPPTAPEFAEPDRRVLYLPEDEYRLKFDQFLSFEGFFAADQGRWGSFRTSLLPNLGYTAGVMSASNDDPLQPAQYEVHLLRLDELPAEELEAALRRMSVSTLLTAEPHPRLAQIGRAGPAYVHRIEDSWPRYSLARCATLEEGLECTPSAELGTLNQLVERPDRLTFEVDVQQAAYLLLNDAYYPGWEAQVDGQPVTIHLANEVFRAVALEPGLHTLTFAYRPASLRWGALISGISLLGLAGLALWPRRV